MRDVTGAALAPLAVLPQYQRRGIAGELVEAGNKMLEDARCPFVIVLGHPSYYPRFGFVPARTHGVSCDWEVPDDAFMILLLDPVKMRGVSGPAEYRHEFSALT